ncbi:hypothetical protein Hanom_Chr06g00521831 [Helianthus anomalus]
MVEKKLRFWFVKDDRKRKKHLRFHRKLYLRVNLRSRKHQKEPMKKKSPPRLVDETFIPPIDLIKEGADLLKMSLADYVKHTTAEGAQGANVEKEVEKLTEKVEASGVNETFVGGLVHTDSSETESDEIDPTKIAPTSYVSGKQKLKRFPKKKKASDEEDATYEPTPKEKKKKGLKKRKAHPRNFRARKDTTSIPQRESKIPEIHEYERVEKVDVRDEDVEVEFMGVRKSTPPPPPPPPINPTIYILEEHEKTPEQQTKKVEEPASKKATTSSSSHGFPKIPHDLGAGPIGLEDAKAEAELEVVKAENVALKKEIEEHADMIDQLTDEIEEVNAQYKTIDEANKTLHEMLGDLHTSTSNENEVLRKKVEALRADKVIKDEQLNMLYTVVEHKLGINVQVMFDEIEIQRIETRRLEREKRLAEEAAESKKDKRKGLVIDTEEILGSTSQPDPIQEDEVNTSNVETSNVNEVEMKEAKDVVDNSFAIIPTGELKDITPEEIRLDRRNIIEKRHSESKDDEEKNDDEKDEELKDLFEAIDNYDGDDDNGDDDNDDDDDDDDQGATRLVIVKRSDPSILADFLNDELNEQQKDQHHEASSS